jgi:tRNA(adenine34) deaminase
MPLTELDIACFQRAIQLAAEAEEQGNLPIGTVISFEGKIIAEGKNTIWFPVFNPNRHAEIEALRQAPPHLWKHARRMTLYSTLEPCLMCLGAILLFEVGRVLYGSADSYGGASMLIEHFPRHFENVIARTEWLGPAYPEECDPLYRRVMTLVTQKTDLAERDTRVG